MEYTWNLEIYLTCLLLLACSRKIWGSAGNTDHPSEGFRFLHLWPLVACMLCLGWDWGRLLPWRFFSPLSKLPIMIFAATAVPLVILAFAYFLKSKRVPVGLCMFVFGSMAIMQAVPDVKCFGGFLADWTDGRSTLIENTVIVGIGEEILKLLPLFLILLVGRLRGQSLYRRMVYTDFLWIGFFSGLGFAIGETLKSYSPWCGQVFVCNQYIRWFTVIPLHAVWTVTCAALLWDFAKYAERAKRPVITIGLCLLATVPSAILHGSYDYVFVDYRVGDLYIRPGLIFASIMVLYVVAGYVLRINRAGEQPPEALTPKGAFSAAFGHFQTRAVLQLLAIMGASVITENCVSYCSLSQAEFNRASVTPGWDIAPFPIDDASDGAECGGVNIARLLRSAEKGNATAEDELARCYYYGRGVPENIPEAAKWWRKAAVQGHARAQRALGHCYCFGNGVAKDQVADVKWTRKAAEQGDAKAQWHLGCCYYLGEGLSANMGKAFAWYSKSAEQGYASAQSSLGMCYLHGQGVTKDLTESAKWYRKAAMQGDVDAWNALRSVKVELGAEK